MTPCSRIMPALLAALVLGAAGAAFAEPARIDNPRFPAHGDQILPAEELWRWGGDEEHDPLLGRVADAVIDADGNVYVLDANLSVIHVLSPEGALLRTIGGEGDGPGEFRNAGEIAWLPGGDLGVLEMMPGRIVAMSPTGEPRSSFRPEGTDGAMMAMPQHFESHADGVVVGQFGAHMRDGGMESWMRLARYDAQGKLLATYRETSQQQSGNSISFSSGDEEGEFISHWTLAPDGRLVMYAQPRAYELEILAADGSPQAVITRPYESLHFSDEEMDAQRKQRESMQQTYGIQTDAPLEEWHRDIAAVIARPNGELWVATSRGAAACPSGSLGVFDVFDDRGRYHRTLRFDGVDYDPDRDDFVVHGDRILVFKEARMASPKMTTAGGGGSTMMMISGVSAVDDEEDDGEFRPMEVVCYRLPEGC